MARFDVAVEPAAREGSLFFHIEDGYHYYWNDEDKNGTIYFKCVQYGKGCRGRARLSPDKGFFHTQAHNGHGVDFLYPDEMAMTTAMLTRCRSSQGVPFRNILEEEGLRSVEQF